jgi:hypothetical protein
MARTVDQSRFSQAPPPPAAQASDRNAARLLAAAAAALLVTILVVSRSLAALGTSGPTNQGSTLAGSSVELTTDDGGRPLFSSVVLVPDRWVANCIAVTYRGNLVPAKVNLGVRSNGALADDLSLRVERGEGGRFGDCRSFRPERVVYEGALAALAAGTGPAATGLPVMSARVSPETTSFRISLLLPRDSTGSGRQATVDFVWRTG